MHKLLMVIGLLVTVHADAGDLYMCGRGPEIKTGDDTARYCDKPLKIGKTVLDGGLLVYAEGNNDLSKPPAA